MKSFECDYIELSELDKLLSEKQNVQKFANNVEPKFKVGDWIVRGDTVAQILDIQEQYYVGLDIDGNDFTSSKFLSDDKIHLWTIQDAKDGDVLVNQNEEMPFIFKSYNKNHVYCYCAYTNHKDRFFPKFVNDDGTDLHWINLLHEQVIPATKEQSGLLFQKMHEAGYEWDDKKKELRKISQEYPLTPDECIKPAWSEEDEKYVKDLSNYFTGGLSLKHTEEDIVNWLKSLKQRIGE